MNILGYRYPSGYVLPLITWGGVGYMRPASGTWGSLAALPFALVLSWLWGAAGLLITAGILYAISYYVINKHERDTGDHDGSYIVIDEVIGMMIALSTAWFTLTDIAAAFFLFRLMDAVKPGIIGWTDKNIKGAHGVLLDDVIAGIVTAFCIPILHVLVWGIGAAP